LRQTLARDLADLRCRHLDVRVADDREEWLEQSRLDLALHSLKQHVEVGDACHRLEELLDLLTRGDLYPLAWRHALHALKPLGDGHGRLRAELHGLALG
jgi:hypothetical protein